MIRMVRYLTVIIPLDMPFGETIILTQPFLFFFPLYEVLHLPTSYYHSIPAAPELGQSRKVDISRLRDIRKRLDTGHITVKELEVIAVECVDELVELCSGKVDKWDKKLKRNLHT